MTDLFNKDRLKLVEQLRKDGIQDAKVLQAMQTVPRHLFIDEGFAGIPYANKPLPIGHGQTISQPYIVAYTTEVALAGCGVDKILEIGTGSGYQAAVLGQLCRRVFTVERIQSLQDKAIQCLRKLDYHNIHCRCSDGKKGWQQFAPYEAIVVTAASQGIPRDLVMQLAVNGRMVIPVVNGEKQDLILLEKTSKEITQTILQSVKFVPLV